MESVVSGFVLDPAKCNQLSLEEKRKLVYYIAQWSEDPPQVLRSLTRGELLQIICAEKGKEIKYTGYTKTRMIGQLLKLVHGNLKKNNMSNPLVCSLGNIHTGLKRQRKQEHPFHQATDVDNVSMEDIKEEHKVLLCQNLACRATLEPEDVFCKRCSCCICHKYDANKDPSLWLTCESDPREGDPCGVSCHLPCALKHERSGVLKHGFRTKLDGNFYCVSCGKVNGLMRTWRRQLLAATEARRVDVLCLRLSLSYQILKETQQYEELQKVVEAGVKKLENEVGPLDYAFKKMDRTIVNRLSCGAEVQKLCTWAIEAFDSRFSLCDSVDEKKSPSCRIGFEELTPTTVTVVLDYEDHILQECLGCKLWHRKYTKKDYPEEATYIVLRPDKKFKLADLNPSTEYSCKVSLFSNTSVLGIWEAKWVTPASRKSSISILGQQNGEEEHASVVVPNPYGDSENYGYKKLAPVQKLAEIPLEDVLACSPPSDPPLTPCKADHRTKISANKRLEERDYECSVKAIRWLEHEGHIDRDFRVKFLTWFSLKSTLRERKVISVFVDALIDDPPSLAGQLIDTFKDEICSERNPVQQPGSWTRFWH